MFTPSSGTVKEHLLRSSFMEDHTQWMGDDDQDDNHDQDGAARSENEKDGNEDDEEDAAHDDEEEVENVEVEDRSTSQTAAMWDPHFQELLMNRARPARANHAARPLLLHSKSK
jgi:hypothetical protein